MIMQLLTQRKLDRQWYLLCCVLALQMIMLCLALYACWKRVHVGTINVTTQPRPLTVEQAAAMKDKR